MNSTVGILNPSFAGTVYTYMKYISILVQKLDYQINMFRFKYDLKFLSLDGLQLARDEALTM